MKKSKTKPKPRASPRLKAALLLELKLVGFDKKAIAAIAREARDSESILRLRAFYVTPKIPRDSSGVLEIILYLSP